MPSKPGIGIPPSAHGPIRTLGPRIATATDPPSFAAKMTMPTCSTRKSIRCVIPSFSGHSAAFSGRPPPAFAKTQVTAMRHATARNHFIRFIFFSLEMLDLRDPALRLFGRHPRKAHHDQPVADLALVGGRAVEAADVAAALADDGVDLEAVAVLDVRAEDLLVGNEPHRLHVVRIQRQRSLVVEARVRDPDPMQLCLQNLQLHNQPSFSLIVFGVTVTFFIFAFPGASNMTSVISRSISARRPRAPVFRASAIFASSRSAFSSNSSSTPSILSSFAYCFTREFFGSASTLTRSSSESSFIVVITGRRPVNSGMSPNLTRSSGRTSARLPGRAAAGPSASAAALKPIARLPVRSPTIRSSPTKAPPQMKRMLEVSTSMYSWSGCFRPPFGGMRQKIGRAHV